MRKKILSPEFSSAVSMYSLLYMSSHTFINFPPVDDFVVKRG